MKLVREYIFEKFIEDDSDPIQDLGIGAISQYKNIFEIFGYADKEQYIYTIVPYTKKGFLDFWFSAPRINKLTDKEQDRLFDYVTNIISKLGFDGIIVDPILIKRFVPTQKKILPSIVRYEIKPQFQHLLNPGEYRRSSDKITFSFYQTLDSNYENEITRNQEE